MNIAVLHLGPFIKDTKNTFNQYDYFASDTNVQISLFLAIRNDLEFFSFHVHLKGLSLI